MPAPMDPKRRAQLKAESALMRTSRIPSSVLRVSQLVDELLASEAHFRLQAWVWTPVTAPPPENEPLLVAVAGSTGIREGRGPFLASYHPVAGWVGPNARPLTVSPTHWARLPKPPTGVSRQRRPGS